MNALKAVQTIEAMLDGDEPEQPSQSPHRVVEIKLRPHGGMVALDSAGRIWERLYRTSEWELVEGPPVNGKESD